MISTFFCSFNFFSTKGEIVCAQSDWLHRNKATRIPIHFMINPFIFKVIFNNYFKVFIKESSLQ